MTFRICYLLVLLIISNDQVKGQSGWDWRDPNDLGFVDFGDSKLLGYNLGGLGIRLLLQKDDRSLRQKFREFSFGVFQEYKRDPLSTLMVPEFRYGIVLRKFISLGGGNRLYVVNTEENEAFGLNVFVWFQWHIFRKDQWRLSYDNGVGPNIFLEAYPVGGTHFNFTTHYGLAFELNINQRWWHIKFLNYHISNADIKGRERNPAMDAIGIRIGVEF